MIASAHGQSLARGAAGTALLPVEQALTGTGTWRDAHAAIKQATAAPVDAGPHAALLHGAPALAFILHAARADGHPRYEKPLATLTGHVERITRQRLAAAHARLRRGEPGTFSEYDLFHGLTGLGVVLLRTAPGSDALAGILRYLAALTRPVIDGGQALPGWWAARDPDPLIPTPGGHANLGMAHGGAGILAFAALTKLSGITADGQDETIAHLQAWYERWRQDGADGPWWPQHLTREALRTGRPAQRRPGRPSLCYKLTELNHEFSQFMGVLLV